MERLKEEKKPQTTFRFPFHVLSLHVYYFLLVSHSKSVMTQQSPTLPPSVDI